MGKAKTYVVESLVKARGAGKTRQYQVKWKGYPHSQNTWEPVSNLKSCADEMEALDKGKGAAAKEGAKTSKGKGGGAKAPTPSSKAKPAASRPKSSPPGPAKFVTRAHQRPDKRRRISTAKMVEVAAAAAEPAAKRSRSGSRPTAKAKRSAVPLRRDSRARPAAEGQQQGQARPSKRNSRARPAASASRQASTAKKRKADGGEAAPPNKRARKVEPTLDVAAIAKKVMQLLKRKKVDAPGASEAQGAEEGVGAERENPRAEHEESAEAVAFAVAAEAAPAGAEAEAGESVAGESVAGAAVAGAAVAGAAAVVATAKKSNRKPTGKAARAAARRRSTAPASGEPAAAADQLVQVEQIVGIRYGATGGVEYRIRWRAVGRGKPEHTWEPEENIMDDDLIDDFEAAQQHEIYAEQKMSTGVAVEVRNIDEGFQNSWAAAKVVRVSRKSFTVEYTDFEEDDGSLMQEVVGRERLRLAPPKAAAEWKPKVDEVIEVLESDCWWEARVLSSGGETVDVKYRVSDEVQTVDISDKTRPCNWLKVASAKRG